MVKILATVLFTLIAATTLGRVERKISTYLLGQYINTIYDRTLGNNPWAIGLELQSILNISTKFKPTLELTGDIYLENDDLFRSNLDGSAIPDVRGMVNLFGGCFFTPTKHFFISFSAGPSFINGQTSLGIKPSLGTCFSRNNRWMAKLSFINIFNRDKTTNEDFGSLNFALGIKLF